MQPVTTLSGSLSTHGGSSIVLSPQRMSIRIILIEVWLSVLSSCSFQFSYHFFPRRSSTVNSVILIQENPRSGSIEKKSAINRVASLL